MAATTSMRADPRTLQRVRIMYLRRGATLRQRNEKSINSPKENECFICITDS